MLISKMSFSQLSMQINTQGNTILSLGISIRTNNMLERIMREIRRRTNVVGCFPDGNSALMLAAARLRHIAGTKWSTARYLNMKRLEEHKQNQMQELMAEVAG